MDGPVHEDADPTLPPGLTSAQREAIVAADPLLCVLAGAGAGKTRVLTLRVGHRIVHGGVDPGRVLVCTFSRKAADELRQRLWALDVGEVVRAATFHRTALSLLRQQRADRGLPPPALAADRRGLLTAVLRDAGQHTSASTGRPAARSGARSGARSTRPAVVAQLDTEIGWAKSSQIQPDDYARLAAAAGRRTTLAPTEVADFYQRYEESRRRQRVLDLDDLLSACATVLAEDGAFADAVRWRFRHLFVDEMQDVTPAQFRLLTSLLGDEPDLMVVGDPNQSVYAWNGADPTLIDRLPSLLPGMRVIALHENHRCSPQVLAVATAALGLEAGGARAPTRNPRAAPTSTRADGTVPVVTAHTTDDDEAAWLAHEVWLAHTPGRSWSQIAILARTNAQLVTVSDALRRAQIPHRHAGADSAPASDLRATEDTDAKRTVRPGGGMVPSGGEWTAAPEGEAIIPPGGEVLLATFHRAKGLQWPVVYVIGLSAGLVPIASARSAGAQAEERRLLYVALTRAEDRLTCSWARFRGQDAAGGAGERAPSPWLAPVIRAIDTLTRESAPLSPRDAVRRVDELRARLQPVGTGDATAGAGDAGSTPDQTGQSSTSTTTGA
jgi:DNA helicase-2/ATP-dependent DNA helicase PcrA